MGTADYSKVKVRNEFAPWVRKVGDWVYCGLMGRKIVGKVPNIPKCVVVTAPHTSNWDTIRALFGQFHLNYPCVIMVKNFWFFWPTGNILRWLGCIPIDRSGAKNNVDQAVEALASHEKINIIIAVEGTRKKVPYWKTGFYWIALKAGVPIMCACIDNKNKAFVLSEPIMPTGNFEADFDVIAQFFREQVGINPQYRPRD